MESQVDPERLRYELGSPLRLRLFAELSKEGRLSLLELVYRSGRNVQDVVACMRPMTACDIVLERKDDASFELNPDMDPDLRTVVDEVLAGSSERVQRERHVRESILGGMIGLDPKMQVVFELIQQVARVKVPALITGETGTGKSLVARAIHNSSQERDGHFVAVNCGAIPETLFESELFGHVKGAFTGAVSDRPGLVQEAHQGTLFLDEIANLPLAGQAKLLRVIQEQTFRPVGSDSLHRVDVRWICATNSDLEAAVTGGQFREDLLYRINVFPIRVPSLRERADDIPYLVAGILAANRGRFPSEEQPTISAATIKLLKSHQWPGNVRELENVLIRAAVMAGDRPIAPADLPMLGTKTPKLRQGAHVSLTSLKDVEKHHIENMLIRCDGNIKATAKLLKISRTTLYKKIKEFGIEHK